MRKTTLFMAACVLCAPALVGAQQVTHTHIFPGVARLAGALPSQWVSDITVNNLQAEAVEIGLLFLEERTEHGMMDFFFPPNQRFMLGPRETVVFRDVLQTVFDVDGTKGLIVLTSDQEMLSGVPGSDQPVIVATMRTYDVSSPVGTYGQSIPANEFILNTSGEQSFLTGAFNDGDFRSNLGLVNVSLIDVTIHYRIFSGTALIVQSSKDLMPMENRQWSFSQLGVGTVDGPLTVDLWLDPDDVRNGCLTFIQGGSGFAGYASKVDSRTQDAEFFWAAPAWVREVECE